MEASHSATRPHQQGPRRGTVGCSPLHLFLTSQADLTAGFLLSNLQHKYSALARLLKEQPGINSLSERYPTSLPDT